MIEFRRAGLADAQTIIHTRQKVWDATYRGIYPDEEIDSFDYEWHLKAERRRQSDPDFHCFLVMDAEKCVGYYSYGKVRPGAWKDFTFRLHSLYLLPAYQGRGMGRRIFEQVKFACQSLDCGKMFLDCHPANEKALAFYRHMDGVITHLDAGHDNPMEDSCTIEYIW